MCAVTGFVLLAAEDLAVQLEVPFGSDANDLPLTTYCLTIGADMLTMLEEFLNESGEPAVQGGADSSPPGAAAAPPQGKAAAATARRRLRLSATTHATMFESATGMQYLFLIHQPAWRRVSRISLHLYGMSCPEKAHFQGYTPPISGFCLKKHVVHPIPPICEERRGRMLRILHPFPRITIGL